MEGILGTLRGDWMEGRTLRGWSGREAGWERNDHEGGGLWEGGLYVVLCWIMSEKASCRELNHMVLPS